MRTKLFLLGGLLALGTLIGCGMEDSVEVPQDNAQVESLIMYRAQMGDQGFEILEELSFEEFKSRAKNKVETRSNPNTESHGDFQFVTPDGNPFHVAGHSMDNPGGVHGAVEQSGPGFIWEGDAYCISTWGNKAVTAWEITGITSLPPPLAVGWQIYTAVEDNGQGANAPSDRVSLEFYFCPPGWPTLCEIYNNDADFADATFIDITSGSIKVQ
jgi:hypothetical protein